MSDRLVEAAGVRPGQSVLDVGTGIGEPAVTAARRVGPEGRVVAIDQAPGMLDLARWRMASLGLTNLELLEMDAETVELDEAGFDAVLSRWGLMFLPDLDGTLARLKGLLAPGGRLAAAVWGEPEQVPLLGLATRTFREVLNATPPAGAPTPFHLADAEAVRARLETAGFEDVGLEPMTVAFEFESAREYASFLRDVGPPPPVLEQLAPERQDEVWAALAAAASPFEGADGRVRLPNTVLIASARRPAGGPRRHSEAAPRRPSCPFCGSRNSRLESPFGSTLGLAQYWCDSCRTVFEYLKWDSP